MKGMSVLIEAMSMLPPSVASLTIVGEGTERTSLEALVKRFDLDRQVTLAGHVEKISDKLHEADAMVLCSVSHESCPAVLAEGMAAGLPLITSDFGPLAEVNLHGETGLVTPVGDARAVANAIRALADNREMAVTFGNKGRERARRFFSLDTMVERTMQLYREALDY